MSQQSCGMRRAVRWAQGGGVGLRLGEEMCWGDVSRQDSVGLCLCQQGGRSLVVTAPTAQAPVVLTGWRARAIALGCSQS